MATLEEQFSWLKEVLDEEPAHFADYYKSDIANYLDIEAIEADDLKDLFGKKFAKFNQSSTKTDVQEFVGNITSYIVMKAQIEEIVDDYFS